MKEISILPKPEEVEHFTIIRCETGEEIEINEKLASIGWIQLEEKNALEKTKTICLNPKEKKYSIAQVNVKDVHT